MKHLSHRNDVLLTAFFLVGASCVSTQAWAQAHPPIIDPIAATIPPSGITIGLQTVMSGLVQPTAGAIAPGDSEHLYIADQIGQVWVADISRHGLGQQRKLFLDISSQIIPLGVGPTKSTTSVVCSASPFIPTSGRIISSTPTHRNRQPAPQRSAPCLQE